jgi:capsular polysaccharide transport system permease protein
MYFGAAALQGRIVCALVLRETQTRFGKSKLGYLWAVIEPFAHVLAFSAIARLMHRGAPLGGSIEVFFATGIVPFFLFRDLSYNLTPALNANRALLFFPVVQNVDVLAARALLELATWALVAMLVAAAFACAGLDVLPADPLRLIAAWSAMALLGAGFGMVSAVTVMFIHTWEKLVHILIRVLYVTSGVYFLPLHLPRSAREFVWWFPSFHGVEWFREAFYAGYESQDLNRAYLVSWGLGLVLLGLLSERLLRRRMAAE